MIKKAKKMEKVEDKVDSRNKGSSKDRRESPFK